MGDQYLGLPDPRRRQPDPAGDESRKRYLVNLRRDLPGPPTDNRYTQSASFLDVQYAAVMALRNWITGCTLRVTVRGRDEDDRADEDEPAHRTGRPPADKAFRKAMPSVRSDPRDEEYGPAPFDHPLAELFEDINEVDTPIDFLSQWTIQKELTGNVLCWLVRDRLGLPRELWVLPTALCTYLPWSDQYPMGAWRVHEYRPGSPESGPFAILPAEDVLHYRAVSHPLYRWDGYSPLTAMARTIDQLNAMSRARKAGLDQGVKPDGVLSVDGISQPQADRLRQLFTQEHAGPEGFRSVIVTDGKSVDFTSLTQSLVDLDFQNGWQQVAELSLAAFGVPATVVGLKEPSSYAAYWAIVQQLQVGKLQPDVNQMAAFFNKHVCRKVDRRARLCIDLPRINDLQLQEEQINTDVGACAITVNQLLAIRNRPPVEGGDVPPKVYEARLMQQFQPAAPGMPGEDPAADPAGGDAHPLDGIGDEVLKALGLGGPPDGQPAPAPPDGKPTPAANGQADGNPFGKALPYDESKVTRNAGRFAPKGQGGGGGQRPAGPATGQPPGNPPTPPSVAPGPGDTPQAVEQAKQHPRVVQAVKALAERAQAIAADLHGRAVAAGMADPADLLHTVDDWAKIFVHKQSDPVAQHLGVSAWVASKILSHLVSHAVAHVKKHLGGAAPRPGRPEPDRPSAPSDRQDGSDGGPPRPDNPAGAGTLPNRIGKAVGASDLAAHLNAFVDSM